MDNLTIHHSFLPHLDAEASLAFYRDTLGFEVRNDVGYNDMRWITVGPAGQTDTSIVLQPPAPPGCGITDSERYTIVEMMGKGTFAGVNLATPDLDATFERLQASDAKVVQEPTDQPYGVRDCAFRDPAGDLGPHPGTGRLSHPVTAGPIRAAGSHGGRAGRAPVSGSRRSNPATYTGLLGRRPGHAPRRSSILSRLSARESAVREPPPVLILLRRIAHLTIDRRLTLGAAVLAVVVSAVSATAAAYAPSAPRAPATKAAAPPLADSNSKAVTEALRNTLKAGAHGAMTRFTGPNGTQTHTEGVRDRKTGAHIDPRARFRIGSVTKTFSSVMLLQLVAEGKVKLDAPVTTYLPGVLPDDRITVRHLLTHRSGLSDYTNAMFTKTVPGFEAVRNRVFTNKELVDLSLREPRTTEPGGAYRYSNTNFVLVGMVIKKVTKNPVAKEYDRRVIKPLKLKDTSYVHPATAIKGRHVRGYLHPDEAGAPLVDSTEQTVSWAQAAGAMISSEADLKTFMSALLRGKLLPSKTLNAMLTMAPADASGTRFYGLGLRRYDLSCGTSVYGHTSTVQGFYTYAFTTRDGKRTLSAMANTSNRGSANTALGGSLEAAFCGKQPVSAAKRGLAAPLGAEADLPENR